jgi:hypothetical protein
MGACQDGAISQVASTGRLLISQSPCVMVISVYGTLTSCSRRRRHSGVAILTCPIAAITNLFPWCSRGSLIGAKKFRRPPGRRNSRNPPEGKNRMSTGGQNQRQRRKGRVRRSPMAGAAARVLGGTHLVGGALGEGRSHGTVMTKPAHRTPRGRNWTLMRGPTGRADLGIACSQVRWQLPPMTIRSPWPRL